MKTFKNTFAVMALFMTAFSVESFAQRGRPEQGPIVVDREFIGKEYSPGDRVFLGKETGIFREYNGREIEKVELEIVGRGRAGQATLLINEQQVSRKTDYFGARAGEQTLVFNIQRPFVIGRNMSNLRAVFSSRVYVKSAAIFLKNNHGQFDREVETDNLFESLRGRDTVNVLSQFPHHIRQKIADRKVESMQIVVTNHDRDGFVRICKKDFNHRGPDRLECTRAVVPRSNSKSRLDFHFAGHMQGSKLRELEIRGRGDITVKKIKADLR